MIDITEVYAPAVSFAPAWAAATLTARGTAGCRLSEFADAWAELTQADRE